MSAGTTDHMKAMRRGAALALEARKSFKAAQSAKINGFEIYPDTNGIGWVVSGPGVMKYLATKEMAVARAAGLPASDLPP